MLPSWSLSDKMALLEALKKYGTNDVISIQKELPNKSIPDIRYAFERYSKVASSRWDTKEKLQEQESPLTQWLKIIKKQLVKNPGVADIISRVLKYIALYEKRADSFCNDIDLSDCYMVLSEISNGTVSKQLSAKTCYFLNQNLTQLAIYLKKKNLKQHKNVIKQLRINSESDKNTKKDEGTNPVLNPLNIPKECLQN